MAQADPSRTEAGHGPPAAGPFSLELPDKSAFVSQATAHWCVPAAMQTMIDLIDDEQPDRSRRTQAALYDLGRENSTDRPTGQGIEPEGWAEGLDLSGSGPYVVHIEPTRRRAIRAAAEAIRLTERPVGLVGWRGAHSWVMSGFEATADPAYTKGYEVTGIYVQDVWYPRVSSIWGVSPEPDLGRIARARIPGSRGPALRGLPSVPSPHHALSRPRRPVRAHPAHAAGGRRCPLTRRATVRPRPQRGLCPRRACRWRPPPRRRRPASR